MAGYLYSFVRQCWWWGEEEEGGESLRNPESSDTGLSTDLHRNRRQEMPPTAGTGALVSRWLLLVRRYVVRGGGS